MRILGAVASTDTISITADAVAAIAATFPEEWGAEARPDGKGAACSRCAQRINLLKSIGGPGESYSDLILRIATAQ
jgi:uncharacterized hydantoinase/oxoprolinase family protein